jgi:hypothetical protein
MYEVLVALTRIEIRAKYMDLPAETTARASTTRGRGVTVVTDNGAFVTL